VNVVKKNDVSPIESNHGEMIYELIGRGGGGTSERLSIAHVVIPSGKSSRLHSHPDAEESYYMMSGQAMFVLDGESTIIGPGQTVLIPPDKSHQITNIGSEDVEFLAICVPAWEPANSIYLDDAEWKGPPMEREEINAYQSRKELIDLYNHFRTVSKEELNLLYQYLNFYVGLLTAILAATLTGLLTSQNLTGSLRELYLLIGPILILALSFVGNSTVNVFYHRFV
jgi:mannose-6-phosphate isomerase-like protein (cupin superfamily)